MSGDVVVNAIRENVRFTVELLTRSGEFAALVDQGELSIFGAVYDLDTGRLTIGDRSQRNEDTSE
jgi:carbonic anhydrase